MPMETPSKSDPARRRTWLRLQALVVALGIPALFLTLSLISVDQLEGMPVLCFWKRLTGAPCPGCGTTRALCSVAHGEWAQAARYNRGVYIVIPVMAWIWLAQLRVLYKTRRQGASPADNATG
jgi:hypothetical protein